ncbi:MAG TPA: cache domain-containing protein [Candidatus Dependentiae bacterium]|nr:cache domain-containing protein [Candidatus Dependentiae bacterium]HRQ63227.1 cache domain-containing protein [Candidatus Dependentiae bacterium]
MKNRLLVLSLLAMGVGLWMFNTKKNANQSLNYYMETDADVDEEADVNQEEPDTQQVVEKDLESLNIDLEKKRKSTQTLVQRAKEYINEHTLEDACSKFSHTKEFIDAELYVYVFNADGVVFAHGQDEDLIWQNLINLRDNFGSPMVQEIIDTGKKGGGWVTYQWRNATKHSWVQPVTKDGVDYVIGAGYYPHSKESTVVSLVKGAVALFDKVLERGQPAIEAFSDMSYPLGNFVFADLYLFVLNEKGELMAQGDRPNLIGTNVWDYKDTNGVLVNQEIIKKATESLEGIWVEYTSKRALKRSYAEKVKDKDGRLYFIICGYYPEETRDSAVDLLRKGYTFMKRSGKSAASDEFTDKQNDDFRYGDLYIVGYDMNGVCFAHGGNPELVGQNLWDARDEDGRYYVREIIEEAKKADRGWLTFKRNRSFQSVYFEPIDLGIGRFVLTCGLYPVSKKETVELLVDTAASSLKMRKREEALGAFVKRDGAFVSGDLDIFVFDDTGLCYAYGTEHDLIWRNLVGLKDDDGKPFIKLFINAVRGGDSKVSFKLNGSRKVADLAPVEKDGIRYVVGSSYYL